MNPNTKMKEVLVYVIYDHEGDESFRTFDEDEANEYLKDTNEQEVFDGEPLSFMKSEYIEVPADNEDDSNRGCDQYHASKES